MYPKFDDTKMVNKRPLFDKGQKTKRKTIVVKMLREN